MSFQNSYKNQMNSIKPDGYIKDKTRRRMAEAGKTPAPKRSGRAIFGTAVAAVLCAALLFSAGVVTGRRGVKVNSVDNTAAMKTVQTYDDIYDSVKKFKTTIWDKIRNYGTADDEVFLYAAEESDTGTNGTASYTTKSEAGTNAASDNADGGTDHSGTTLQVEGVDEADIVKTDGKYIYILSYTSNQDGVIIKIIDVTAKKPRQLKSIEIDGIYNADMYLSGNRLVVCGQSYSGDAVNSVAVIFDVTDPGGFKELTRCTQSGYYSDSRLIGGRLYVISNYTVNTDKIQKSRAETFVPSVYCKDYDGAVGAETVRFYDNCGYPEYTVLCGYDINDGALYGTQSVLGGSYTVYASTENIIVCGYADGDGLTQVARFSLDGGEITLKATGKLNGSLLNQFSIDEYKGFFRFVLTDYTVNSDSSESGEIKSETADSTVASNEIIDRAAIAADNSVNTLVILDGNLKERGKITDIARGERVYSARFMGDTAFFVTFRQVDPLFSVDVSDPDNPKIIGSLKIPGFSSYLFPYGGKLLGLGKNADENTGRTGLIKLSMFDISNPANVTESSKTDVPAYTSDALYNHKATLADYGKNIIGFPAWGSYGVEYYVYSYQDGKFVQRLKANLNIKSEQNCRGLYIGNIFYVAAPYELQYYNLDTFELIGTLRLDG
ncbi:MAG: beta-propeller domain-containing protein [Acutalibacteraceae bacterium]